jgi:hypothetical protein
MLVIENHLLGFSGELGVRHPYRPLKRHPGQADSFVDPGLPSFYPIPFGNTIGAFRAIHTDYEKKVKRKSPA